MLYFITKLFFVPFVKIFHRFELVGYSKLPWRKPFIVVANHASFLDPWYLAVMFLPRHIHYVVTTKYYSRNRFYKFFFDIYGCIPVNPERMELSTIKRIMKALKKGKIVGIFPEGRVCHDGQLQPFHSGAIYVSQRAKVPIIPAAICGSFDALPRQGWIPKPRKIKIIRAEPILFSNDQDKDDKSRELYDEEIEKIRDWIADQLEEFENQKKRKWKKVKEVRY